MNLSILYRGPLASCNYDCPYCPFAKRRDSAAALAADRWALERFCAWVTGARGVDCSILFTPWGEALTRHWYRDAIVQLSHLANVGTVSVQTNLSRSVAWLGASDPARVSLWCTYHPGETQLEPFVRRCGDLAALGVAHSVGVVGVPAHLADARRLREALDGRIYLWVNPASGLDRPYDEGEIAAWTELDPLFPLALRSHDSRGSRCRTGESVISVDGDGTVRRCHFVPEVIGNLYDGSWRDGLRPRRCPNATCDCFIGYVHRDAELYDGVFGSGVLGRIPNEQRVLLGRTSAS